MKIEGIGIVSKKEVENTITHDGLKAWNQGELSSDEVIYMYKREKVKELSIIGGLTDTFNFCYKNIPTRLIYKLSPEDLALLVAAFYFYPAHKQPLAELPRAQTVEEL